MPKKSTRKDGGRLGGMTEEEKLIFMQRKASAEEDMAERKEDMLTQFLTDKLQKEERNSAVNLHKLTQQWRTVFRQARADELRRDIAVLSQTFERVLDRKDSVVKCLVGDLKEAEQQSSQASRSHLQCLDRLLELQSGRLASLEQNWNRELEEFNSEREMILSQHQQECAYLEDVTFTMEQRYREVDGEARQEYQSTQDEIKNKNIEEKHTLRLQLEGKAEELWRQFQQAQRSYNEATEHRHIVYESLRARDQSSAREIDAQRKKLLKIQDSIAALRAKLSSSQRESELAAWGLQAARDEVTLQSQQLKAQLTRARTVERSRLTSLTVHSNAVAKMLQGIIHKGEKLMRLAEMCRKLETEQEKVLPFYSSSLSAEEQSLERANAMEAPSEELAQAMLDYSVLDRFWQRYNKALLERLCLERERSVLSQENRQLRVLLRQYLDGISVSSKILRSRNPLFRVSRPVLTVLPAIDAHKKRHTVVEAAHVVQRTLKTVNSRF